MRSAATYHWTAYYWPPIGRLPRRTLHSEGRADAPERGTGEGAGAAPLYSCKQCAALLFLPSLMTANARAALPPSRKTVIIVTGRAAHKIRALRGPVSRRHWRQHNMCVPPGVRFVRGRGVGRCFVFVSIVLGEAVVKRPPVIDARAPRATSHATRRQRPCGVDRRLVRGGACGLEPLSRTSCGEHLGRPAVHSPGRTSGRLGCFAH